jgi:type IV secretion system protein VirB10
MDLAPPDLAPGDAGVDPHAPKLSPDDPRLRLSRPAPRTLRAAPLAAVAAALLGAASLAVAFALESPHAQGPDRPDPSGGPAPPTLPESVRNAPDAPTPHALQDDAGARFANGMGAARSTSPSPGDRTQRSDEERDLRARNAPVLFDMPGASTSWESERTAPAAALPLTAPRASAASAAAADSDPNLQDRKNAFVGELGAAADSTLTASVEHPKSPFEVKAGTVIPAVLVTGINSDLPGPVIGQVREAVYDTVSGNTLLIPQGSRLLAHYDSMVAWGQERVLVCWNRLLFPDGDSIRLECMPAADLQGAAGLTDEVDEHWMRILKGAAVASLLAATATAVAGNTDSFNPTVPQTWARNAAGDVNQVGQQLTRRNLMVQPTITVRPGFSVNVVVTKDIVLAPYPDPAAGAPQ